MLSQVTAVKGMAFHRQEKMDFLRKDLAHLFDDQGIDQSAYDSKVNFEDPITKYSTVKGLTSLHSCLNSNFRLTSCT